MHNGMVRLDKAKMAKSVGNIFVLHDGLATYGHMVRHAAQGLTGGDATRIRGVGNGFAWTVGMFAGYVLWPFVSVYLRQATGSSNTEECRFEERPGPAIAGF